MRRAPSFSKFGVGAPICAYRIVQRLGTKARLCLGKFGGKRANRGIGHGGGEKRRARARYIKNVYGERRASNSAKARM